MHVSLVCVLTITMLLFYVIMFLKMLSGTNTCLSVITVHFCVFTFFFFPERDEADNLCLYASRNFYWISSRTLSPKRKASLRRGMTLTTFLHFSPDHSLSAVLEEERGACACSLGQRSYRETCSCKRGSSKQLSACS